MVVWHVGAGSGRLANVVVSDLWWLEWRGDMCAYMEVASVCA